MSHVASFPIPFRTIVISFLVAVLSLAALPGRAEPSRTLAGHVPEVLGRLQPLERLDLTAEFPRRNCCRGECLPQYQRRH